MTDYLSFGSNGKFSIEKGNFDVEFNLDFSLHSVWVEVVLTLFDRGRAPTIEEVYHEIIKFYNRYRSDFEERIEGVLEGTPEAKVLRNIVRKFPTQIDYATYLSMTNGRGFPKRILDETNYIFPELVRAWYLDAEAQQYLADQIEKRIRLSVASGLGLLKYSLFAQAFKGDHWALEKLQKSLESDRAQDDESKLTRRQLWEERVWKKLLETDDLRALLAYGESQGWIGGNDEDSKLEKYYKALAESLENNEPTESFNDKHDDRPEKKRRGRRKK